VPAAESKRNADLDAKEAARRAMQESINRSRQAQIDRKRQQREAELAEQQRFSSEWSTIQKQLEQEERDAKEERRQRELALQADILRQAAARNAELRQARERHRTDEVAAAAQAKLAEADFFKTADRCVPVCVCVCVLVGACVWVCVCVCVCVCSLQDARQLIGALNPMAVLCAGLSRLKSRRDTTPCLQFGRWSAPRRSASYPQTLCFESLWTECIVVCTTPPALTHSLTH
jgi:multidrug efflux pump subunit AcrA (membrane-fusion protein)